MKETANSNEVLEKVTNIILKYVETPALNILMQYIPMDNSRIQILLDLIERKYGSNHNILHESLLDL
jgi:DNA-binding protein Fis